MCVSDVWQAFATRQSRHVRQREDGGGIPKLWQPEAERRRRCCTLALRCEGEPAGMNLQLIACIGLSVLLPRLP